MNSQYIQKKIQDYLRGQGAYVFKTIKCNRAGIPDIIACLDGRFLGIEVKHGSDKLSRLQTYNLEQIQLCGGVAMEARSVIEVEEHLKTHQRW